MSSFESQGYGDVILLTEAVDVRDWRIRQNCPEADLREAVGEAGPSAGWVLEYLLKRARRVAFRAS